MVQVFILELIPFDFASAPKENAMKAPCCFQTNQMYWDSFIHLISQNENILYFLFLGNCRGSYSFSSWLCVVLNYSLVRISFYVFCISYLFFLLVKLNFYIALKQSSSLLFQIGKLVSTQLYTFSLLSSELHLV